MSHPPGPNEPISLQEDIRSKIAAELRKEVEAEFAKMRNPGGRLTTPEDVAQAIAALMDERTHWLTGNVIRVDGGEDIVT